MENYTMYKGIKLTHSKFKETTRIERLISLVELLSKETQSKIFQLNDYKGELNVTLMYDFLDYRTLSEIQKGWNVFGESNINFTFTK
jgi:hypothetical protein